MKTPILIQKIESMTSHDQFKIPHHPLVLYKIVNNNDYIKGFLQVYSTPHHPTPLNY